MYMDCRIDEETIREMEYDGELQKSFGLIKRPTEPLENYQMRLKIMGNYLRQSKYDIVAFLAMANTDLGKPETAADWLSKRLLAVREPIDGMHRPTICWGAVLRRPAIRPGQSSSINSMQPHRLPVIAYGSAGSKRTQIHRRRRK